MPRKTNDTATHDAYNRALLAYIDIADAIFRAAIPKRLRRLLVGLPKRVAGEMVSEWLRSYRADMHFVYQLKGGGELHLLVEFKSSREKWTAWQLLKYEVAIYDLHSKGEDGSFQGLPLVYTLVLHNGPRQWRKMPDVKSLVRGSEAVKALVGQSPPEPAFDLCDTKKLVPLLDHHPQAQAGCRALTIGGHGNPSISELEALFRALPDKSRFESETIGYIVPQCMGRSDRVRTAMNTVKGERGVKMIDEMRSKVLHQAHAEGEQKGRAEGKAEVLAKQLKLKFGR
ncbi:MAG: Rpn family recombination-promoting nuclease/putative transposase, partial [Pseudomonadales bacterium]